MLTVLKATQAIVKEWTSNEAISGTIDIGACMLCDLFISSTKKNLVEIKKKSEHDLHWFLACRLLPNKILVN